ncbi:MAG: C-terminal binding protein [Actinomycetales bacterium]|nr:C-terminal binding protein [Actinomycetales bacterium]
MTFRILITDNDLGDSELETGLISASLSAEVTVRSCKTEQEVLAAVAEIQPHGIIVQWAPITKAVLLAATSLKVISRIGIGIDMIDVEAAEAAGVDVRNVPHYCIEEVATHAFAIGLSLWRQLPQLDADIRSGLWNAAATAPKIKKLSESTIGLIGLGRIGTIVAQHYASWGARVLVHDPFVGTDGFERVTLEQLASQSDLISLHAPLLADTFHVVNEDFLNQCAKKPIIVNTSRGPLIDAEHLALALHDGRIGGAGLDVFEAEPLTKNDALRNAPNTILTPHAAWCSVAALPELRRQAAGNIVDFFSKPTAAR